MDRRRRVLVVEDEPLIQIEIADALESAEYRVVTESTVQAALARLATERFDVAVLDYNLRGEPAEPVARALTGSDTPYIVCSGYSDRDGVPEIGSFAVLDKPFSRDRLLDLVGSAFRSEHGIA